MQLAFISIFKGNNSKWDELHMLMIIKRYKTRFKNETIIKYSGSSLFGFYFYIRALPLKKEVTGRFLRFNFNLGFYAVRTFLNEMLQPCLTLQT